MEQKRLKFKWAKVWGSFFLLSYSIRRILGKNLTRWNNSFFWMVRVVQSFSWSLHDQEILGSIPDTNQYLSLTFSDLRYLSANIQLRGQKWAQPNKTCLYFANLLRNLIMNLLCNFNDYSKHRKCCILSKAQFLCPTFLNSKAIRLFLLFFYS